MSQTKAQLIDAVDGSIVTADLADDAVNAAKLASNAVVNASVDASAAIAGSKISPSFTANTTITAASPVLRLADSTDPQGTDGIIGKLEFFGNDGSSGGADVRSFVQTISTNSTGNAHALTIGLGESNNAPTEKIRILGDGNVGIGETSPTYPTEIKVSDTTAYSQSTTNSTQHQLRINNAGLNGVAGILLTAEPSSGSAGHAGIRVISPSSGKADMTFSVRDGGTYDEKLRILNDGNVGIGTTSPSSILHLESSSPALRLSDTDNSSAFSLFDGNGANLNIHADKGNNVNNSTIGFGIDNSIRMTLNSSGHLGIGTTAPTCPLQVDAGSSGSGTSTALELNHKGNDLNDAIKLNFARAGGDIGSFVFDKVNNNNTTDFILNTRASNTVSETVRVTGGGTIKLNGSDNFIHTNADTAKIAIFGGSTNSVSNGGVVSMTGINHSAGCFTDLAAGTGGHVQFRIGTSHAMRINSSGKVGIGTTTPDAKLSVEGTANNDNSEIRVTATGVCSGYLGSNSNGFNIGTDTAGLILKTGVTGGGSVGATGTARLSINSAGNVTVNTGNIIIGTSGKGIDFSASADGNNVSTGSEVLTEYEEGSFDMGMKVAGGSIVSTTSTVCRYVKVGGIVQVAGRLILSNHPGGSGDLRLTGLPFSKGNPSADGNADGICIYVEGAKTEVTNSISGLVLDSDTVILIRRSGTTASGNDMAQKTDTGTTILFGGTYNTVA